MGWWWWLQLGADAVVVAAVVVALRRMRRSSLPRLEEFLAEASSISQRFDRLLNDKRQLVKATLQGLDSRVNELKALIHQADERIAALKALSEQVRSPAGHEQILAMAAEGKSPQEIARTTGRSIGEVELVLGLGRQRGR